MDFLLPSFNVALMKIKRRQVRSTHRFLPSQARWSSVPSIATKQLVSVKSKNTLVGCFVWSLSLESQTACEPSESRATGGGASTSSYKSLTSHPSSPEDSSAWGWSKLLHEHNHSAASQWSHGRAVLSGPSAWCGRKHRRFGAWHCLPGWCARTIDECWAAFPVS